LRLDDERSARGLARHRARFQRGGVHARGDSVFMRGERKRIYMLSLCFLKKERNRKKRPPQPCQPKKKITQDSLFLVDFEPTTMKKKNSSPPLSCDDF
jgi:hypothetical protein